MTKVFLRVKKEGVVTGNTPLGLVAGLTTSVKLDRTGDNLSKKGWQDDIQINAHQDELRKRAEKWGITTEGLLNAIQSCGSRYAKDVHAWLLKMGYIK